MSGLSNGLPGAVLFACNANQVRSVMAEGLMKLLYGVEVYVDSCGARPEAERDPFVELVMDELGADTSRHVSKGFDDLDEGAFDVVVSLTPEAQHHAVEMGRGAAVEVEYWPVSDPSLESGSREAVIDAYRRTRDELAAKIVQRFGQPTTAGG